MKFFIIFIFILSFSYCKQTEKEKVSSTKTYYDQAVAQKKSKNYESALAKLDQLDKTKSYSKYNSLSKLLRADIYYAQRKYPEALAIYKEIQILFPTFQRNKILFKLGLCHLKKVPSRADTDLSEADKALAYFKKVTQSSGKNSYSKKAQENIYFLINLKAEKELKTALFYQKRKQNKVAFSRLQRLLKEYPKSSSAAKALLESYVLAKKLKKSSKTFKRRLLKEFPKSKEAQKVKTYRS